MAILSGTPVDGTTKIEVKSITYTTDNAPSGWYQVNREDIPEYPSVEVGKNPIMLYDTETNEFSFDIVDRELTEDELKDKELEELQELLNDATSLLLEGEIL